MPRSSAQQRPLVVLTHPYFPEIIRRELAPHARVAIASSRSDLIKLLPNADGLIPKVTDRIDEPLLAHAPKLRAIGNYGAGIDHIDLACCRRRAIRVTNTPDVLTRATAELALTLLLAAARKVPEGESLCRSGQFEGWDPAMLLGLQLKGRTAVLVGQGRIGKETAQLFKALGLKIRWITRNDDANSIRAKLKIAQVLSLHVPLKPETRHWLNATKIVQLPRDAIVINTTRGAVVDERALIHALQTRRIFAAGLDVYEQEPHIPPALRRLPNVVLLPHVGSATREAREAMTRLAISGVLGLLGGKAPPNEVKL
jgi:glyoxylate reductase